MYIITYLFILSLWLISINLEEMNPADLAVDKPLIIKQGYNLTSEISYFGGEEIMTQEGQGELKVKNTNIKQIFQTMEYGQVSENINLSKVWLKEKRNGMIYTFMDNKKEGPKGTATELKDVNDGNVLTTLYSPQQEEVQKIILKSAESNTWGQVEATKRGILLDRLAQEVEKNSTLICQLEVSARGILSSDTKNKALPLLIEYLQYYSGWAIKNRNQNEKWKPEAVFGFVLGPALAAGYNVILQTEPKISLVAALIVELAEKVGIPEGVIKLLPGTIKLDSIFNQEKITIISSFGNLYAKKYDNMERSLKTQFLAVTNSKIPMIVFNSGDLDSACDSVVDAAWGYQGLLPWSVNTLLVQEDILQVFVDKLKYRLSKVKMGTATDKMADVSYPISVDAVKKLQQTIIEAKLQGIEVFQCNRNSETFQPTLLIGGRVFGNNVILEDQTLPVVTVLGFRTTNEAVSLANNSRYDIGASVWTENIGLANEVAAKLNVGNLWINCYGNLSASIPICSRKQSGIGHFGGVEGFFEYVTDKQHNLLKPEQFPNPDDQSVRKDPCAVVEAAKKGQEVWNKMTSFTRSQILRKVANEISARKDQISKNPAVNEDLINLWISAIYEGISQISNLGSVSIQKSYELKSHREAVGVIAVEGDFLYVKTIVGALLLGNAVIILNPSVNYLKFSMEVCKVFSACNIPPGVFSVIPDYNENRLSVIMTHKNLSVYFMSQYNDSCNKIKVRHLKYLYTGVGAEKWEQIVIAVTKVKNIWSNIGNSVL